MKLLLSAYACAPNRGSEPGVGWNWAIEISRLGHEVWVLTRAINRPQIEAEISKHPPRKNLNFLYFDLPKWARWWKRGPRGIHLYYFLWQIGAYRFAAKAHDRTRFDQVQHITFVSIRQSSFLGSLGIPFIFGPVAGGERAPLSLRSGAGVKGWIKDAVRDLANVYVGIDPFVRQTVRRAERIIATSEETAALLPAKYRRKTDVHLAIGIDPEYIKNETKKLSEIKQRKSGTSILFVGRLLYVKGMHLGIAAFARFQAQVPEARLTIVGEGPEERRWRKMADRLSVSKCIEWIPWLPQNELMNVYDRHDVLMFPSLHDSGGTVVLEALARGLPVVTLDIGGPGRIVDETCGVVVATKSINRSSVEARLGNVLEHLSGSPEVLARLSEGARRRSVRFSWPNVVGRLYSPVE